MHLIDLHCDTLYKVATENLHFNSENLEVRLNPENNDSKLQCYAIWIPDDYTGDEAEDLFFKAAKLIQTECKQNNIKLINANEKLIICFSKTKTQLILQLKTH